MIDETIGDKGSNYKKFYMAGSMSLEIYSMSFTRDNRKLFLIISLGEIIFILILFSIHYFVSFNKDRSSKITVQYKPLGMEESGLHVQKHFEYINNNFDNSQLSLEMVSKVTGVPQRQIAKEIQMKPS